LVVVACGGGEATPTTAPTPTPASQLKVTLAAVDTTGQLGTATLTAKGDQTEVVIDVTSGPAGVAQPAHIHDVECQLPPKVTYPLTNVVGGKSTTTVKATLAALQAGPSAVCVHKSPQEITTYTAVGLLPRAVAKSFEVPVVGLALPKLEIPVGTTVFWQNTYTEPHTVTSGKDGKFDGKGWNSPQLAAGRVFSYTFAKTGTFDYTCQVHPTLNSTIKVTEKGAPSVIEASGKGGTGYGY
jgi:plastocyanin